MQVLHESWSHKMKKVVQKIHNMHNQEISVYQVLKLGFVNRIDQMIVIRTTMNSLDGFLTRWAYLRSHHHEISVSMHQ